MNELDDNLTLVTKRFVTELIAADVPQRVLTDYCTAYPYNSYVTVFNAVYKRQMEKRYETE